MAATMSDTMLKIQVKCKVFNESDNPLPKYETSGAAGMDVCSNEDVEIAPGKVVAVKTGLYFEIAEGYEIQVRPRSGLSMKTGLRVANSLGTLDSDWRGNSAVLLWNTDNVSYFVKKGDRIAQLVLSEVPKISWVSVASKNELLSTDRGESGFGSTGK